MQRCPGNLKEGWILQQFFFQESHLLPQTLVGRKENAVFGGSDGDLGWLSAKHYYKQSMYIFLLNPHDKLTREIFIVSYPEGESKV